MFPLNNTMVQETRTPNIYSILLYDAVHAYEETLERKLRLVNMRVSF